jgi:adenosine deaminase
MVVCPTPIGNGGTVDDVGAQGIPSIQRSTQAVDASEFCFPVVSHLRQSLVTMVAKRQVCLTVAPRSSGVTATK